MAEVIVGEKSFNIDRVSPAQVAGIAGLISRMNVQARTAVMKAGLEGDGNAILWSMLGQIGEKDLIQLAALVIGSDKKFAEENFDMVWISEAFANLVEVSHLQVVVANFMRIFTLAVDSESPLDTSEESSDVRTSTS